MPIPIYVINLPNRTDRKTKILQEFTKHNITDYTITTAIHGNTLDVEQMEKDNLISFSHRRLKKGEYGCYLSHLNIYKKILESPEELHLVLEDDVYFVDRFNNKLKELLEKVSDVEWDIFYIGRNCHKSASKCKEGIYIGNKRDGIYYPEHPFFGTHAYIIKKSTLLRIIDNLVPIILPIDLFLMTLLDIKKLTLVNRIVKVERIDSDTQSII